MKLELPWIVAAVIAFLAAKFNNSYEKHLEVYAPLIICTLALVASYWLFKEREPRTVSLLPFFRFLSVGFIFTIIIYSLWMQFATPYLKETGMGLVPLYLIFGTVNLVCLAGCAIYELVKLK